MAVQPGVPLPKTVKIKDGILVWNCDQLSAETEYRLTTEADVIAFANLADETAKAAPSSIRKYALEHGVIDAIQVDPKDPRWKDPRWEDFYAKNLDFTFRMKDGTFWLIGRETAARKIYSDGREPIELWLQLAQRLRAALRINAALKGRTRRYASHAGGDRLRPAPVMGTHEDWLQLNPVWQPPDIANAQWAFHLEINCWLKIGGVRPHLGLRNEWSNTKVEWRLETAYNGLVGGLAHGLLMMVIGDRLFTCDGCQKPYVREKRAPRPGQENFCNGCTDIAGKRATQRCLDKKKKADR